MYKRPSNISSPKKVNQTYKGKRNRRNPISHHNIFHIHNNLATINFKTNFPKLFTLPKVQLKKKNFIRIYISSNNFNTEI